jgi:hypothetical protein
MVLCAAVAVLVALVVTNGHPIRAGRRCAAATFAGA